MERNSGTCYKWINSEDIKLSEISQLQKDKHHMIYLYEVARVVKLIETEVQWWFPRAGGGRNGEFLFNGHRVSVFQDEKVLEIGHTTI